MFRIIKIRNEDDQEVNETVCILGSLPQVGDNIKLDKVIEVSPEFIFGLNCTYKAEKELQMPFPKDVHEYAEQSKNLA